MFPLRINTKLRLLFAAAAARGGGLTRMGVLADKLGVTGAAVTHWFGPLLEQEPRLLVPAGRLGQVVKLFQDEGVPVQPHWLRAPLDEFERLLRGGGEPTVLVWPDAVRLHGQAPDGLALLRPAVAEGFRLRLPGHRDRSALPRFRIDELAYVSLEIPSGLTPDAGSVYATVVHEAPHETVCLFPPVSGDGSGLVGSSLRLPPGVLANGEPACFEVTGPEGVQRVHALLSLFHPPVAVHAGLEGAALQEGLDGLARSLASRAAAEWRLLTLAYEVTAWEGTAGQ